MPLPIIHQEYRLGADPELRYTPSGMAVCEMRAVAGARKKTDAGEWVDGDQSWVNLVAFKNLAENCAESLSKGDLVVAIGKLKVENYEDKDGNKRIAVKVTLDAIGPSLTWATAKVARTTRTSGEGSSSSGGGTQGEDPWTTDPPAESTTQSSEPPF